MNVKHLIKIVLFPSELLATVLLFRKLGANWLESIKNGVSCLTILA